MCLCLPPVFPPFLLAGSVFKRGWEECPDEWRDPAIAEGFAVVRQMRDLAMRALDEARESKAIRSSLEATACVAIGEQALWEELHVSVHCSVPLV